MLNRAILISGPSELAGLLREFPDKYWNYDCIALTPDVFEFSKTDLNFKNVFYPTWAQNIRTFSIENYEKIKSLLTLIEEESSFKREIFFSENSTKVEWNYFSNYYCTDPNKVNRWQNILNNSNSSSDEYAVANYHMTNYNSLCNGNGTYNNNYYAALDQQEIQWNADSWFSNSDLLSGNYAGYDNLYNSIFTPIDACSQNNNPSTYAYNNPQCLFENLNSFACNNSNVITPATNVSNNFGLDMKTQQDGQFILNTNSWFCQQ
jgi:hypothetical protein